MVTTYDFPPTFVSRNWILASPPMGSTISE
jgi:hypothetical protein